VRDGLRLLKQRDEIWKTDLRTKIKHGMDSVRSDRDMSSAHVAPEIVAFKAKRKKAYGSKSCSRPLDSDRSASAEPSSHLDHTCFGESIWSSIAKSLHLPNRELQIVQHVFDDHKETSIAQALRISPHTINTYLQRIYHKLHVFSRAQLVLRVVIEFLDLQEAMGAEELASPRKCPTESLAERTDVDTTLSASAAGAIVRNAWLAKPVRVRAEPSEAPLNQTVS
jgi:DNA-binding CsgD family transcriptional regulator